MTARCDCHGMPTTWCRGFATVDLDLVGQSLGLPPIGPDGLAHTAVADARGHVTCAPSCEGWHDGAVVFSPGSYSCALCGADIVDGEQAVKMPMPCWDQPYAHLNCPVQW